FLRLRTHARPVGPGDGRAGELRAAARSDGGTAALAVAAGPVAAARGRGPTPGGIAAVCVALEQLALVDVLEAGGPVAGVRLVHSVEITVRAGGRTRRHGGYRRLATGVRGRQRGH